MKTKYYLIYVFVCLLSVNFSSHASPNHLDIYHQANIAYQEKNYEKAIELYNDLLKEGQFAPELFFNLGNAYYKAGNIPRSILNYERALKMDSKDEEAQFNLKIASLKIIDKVDPVPQIFYKRWLDTLTNLLSSNDWSKLLIVFIWLSLITSLMYLFGYSVSLRKTGFILSLAFLSLSLFSFLIASRSYSKTQLEQSAIVMSPSVYVKSSPDLKGNDLFIIHEGIKVELLDELNDWKKIKLVNGNIGWLMTKEIEVI